LRISHFTNAFEDRIRQNERNLIFRTAGNGETSTLFYANKFFQPVHSFSKEQTVLSASRQVSWLRASDLLPRLPRFFTLFKNRVAVKVS